MTTLAQLKINASNVLDEATVTRWFEILERYSGRWIDNRESAQLATELLVPTSYRTVESWADLRTQSVVVNRRRLQRPEDVAVAVLRRFAAGQQKRVAFNAAALETVA